LQARGLSRSFDLSKAEIGVVMVEDKGIVSDDIKGLDDDTTDVVFTLVSKDGQRFEVERSILIQSDLIKKLNETDKDATEFPLLHVNGSIVEKVIKYMRYHHNNPAKEIEKPLKSSNMREVIKTSPILYLRFYLLFLGRRRCLGCRFCRRSSKCPFRYDPGCKLYGRQAHAGFDLCQNSNHAERQIARRNS
jgi:hypothetical protein